MRRLLPLLTMMVALLLCATAGAYSPGAHVRVKGTGTTMDGKGAEVVYVTSTARNVVAMDGTSVTVTWRRYADSNLEPFAAPVPPPPPVPTPTPEAAPTPTPIPDPTPATFAQPSCVTGATQAATAAAVRSAVQAGQNVCVTANVGNVNLDSLKSSTTRHVGTSGSGALGGVSLTGSSNITLRARLRSAWVQGSDRITIDNSVLGGTAAARTLDNLVFINGATNVAIRDSDLGWTTADNGGNTGYGVRGIYDTSGLTIERNYLHDIAADGVQLGSDGANIVIDRNEFARISPPCTSSEHSDDIQWIGAGANGRITNNYMHGNGLFGGVQCGGSGPYIHAGDSNSLLFANNLIRDEYNYMQVGGLGTGGCARSNLTFRNNTFSNNGLLWGGASATDLQWRLCSGSANNAYDRNLVVAQFGQDNSWAATGTTATSYLHGTYSLDSDGNCTDAACNPAGGPVGYRKPAGVHW